MTPTEQFHADGAQQWLIRYPANESSVIFDVGGYLGEFTMEILRREFGICSHCGSRVNPYIHVFEPVPDFAERCARRFSDYRKVRVWPFGLGGHDQKPTVCVNGSSTSIYEETHNALIVKAPIEIRDVTNFVYENKIESIELISINIEGMEYDLLNRMIDSDFIKICRNVQVQFHDLTAFDCKSARAAIQKRLTETHDQKWNYDFVWESWGLRAHRV